jgi:hypothetical protein
MEANLHKKVWWDFLEEDLRELLHESIKLLTSAQGWTETFHDYSFVVFPAAKAYEGYLKKVFLKRGFITSEDYYGKHFRIGKALNPALDRKVFGPSVYDKVSDYCGSKDLADRMWETWKDCRNLLFHWFPNEQNAISLEEARVRIQEIIDTMDQTFGVCIVKTS